MIIDFWQIIKTSTQFIFSNWLFFVVVVVITIAGIILKSLSVRKLPKYQYKLKDLVMTRSEFEFFRLLIAVSQNRYDVFPQIHLDAILNYKISGPNWFGAFRHINEKSVDFLLCDKNYGKPILAIELDDRSHDQKGRIIRDEEVWRIFQSVGLPLLRVKNDHILTQEEVSKLVSTTLAEYRK